MRLAELIALGFARLTGAQRALGATRVAGVTPGNTLVGPTGKAPAGAAERSKTVRVATFGNSLSVAASTYAAANLNPMVAAMPGGATINQYLTDSFALGLLYPQARLVAQGGIAAQTIPQMLARDTLAASATRYATADVLAQSPDVVLLHLPTNDLASVTAGTYTAVMDAAKAAATALIGRLLASNAKVLDYGCPGYSNALPTLALVRQAVLEWNAWCRTTLAATFGAAGYTFLDPLNVTHDATGAYLPSMSYDGVHLGGWGQYRLAQLAAAELAVLYGQPAKGVFEGNFIANASMAAQVANAWGVQATGYTITAANGTKSNSQVAVINGVAAQSIEVRGLTDWQLVRMAVPCDLTATAAGMTGNAALTADEFVQLECDVFIESLGAAPVAFNTIDLAIILTGASGGQIHIATALPQTVTTAGTTRVALHLATPDVAALAQGGFVSSSAQVSFYAATACPDIRVGISGARVTKARRPVAGVAFSAAQNAAPVTGVLGETAAGAVVNGAGATVLTKSGARTTFPGAVVAAAGTAAAPGLAFADDLTTGIFKSTGNIIDFSIAGLTAFRYSANGFFFTTSTGSVQVSSGGAFAFSSGTAGSAGNDVFLFRGGPGVLEQRNGTNAQRTRIFNAGDATNGEWLDLGFQANIAVVGSLAAGAGVQRPLHIRGSSVQMWAATHFFCTGDGTASVGVIPRSAGVATLVDPAGSSFSRLQFGGATASFPALKLSGVALQARLADDSGFTDFQARSLIANSVSRVIPVPVGSLPSASASGAGAEATVNDATSPAWGATVAGGGAVTVGVRSNGTNWIVF